MEDDELTQCTQNTQPTEMDPRRLGQNNSGLSPQDVADVMCILHPSTPAAFHMVTETAKLAPQHILQHIRPASPDPSEGPPADLNDQDTFVLNHHDIDQPMDLAFRFSSITMRPHLGFAFGRNLHVCDIAPTTDIHKRVSNCHFLVYINEAGVLMLKDTSTNGTMVDDTLLKGKCAFSPNKRMLNHGSTIQILSPTPEEALKFIVRIPSRQGHLQQYERRYRNFLDRKIEAEILHRAAKAEGAEDLFPNDDDDEPITTTVHAPLLPNNHGMKWDGGRKYNVIGQIGKGAFASVYQLATKEHGTLFAVKELEKRRFMKNGVLDQKLENEMNIMQSIDHPSVVQYQEHWDAGNHLYIIMEFVPCGDLQQYLTEYGAIQEVMAQQMAAQVFDALDYLHAKRITHRDIKPDNILLASRQVDKFVIKLSDFGLSKVVKDNDTFLKTFCGTLLYCAPEVFPHYDSHVPGTGTKRNRQPPPPKSNKAHCYSQAVDIWSFGAVLWTSLCNRPPFEGVADATGRGMFDNIMMTPLDTSILYEIGISEPAISLLCQMLNTDPTIRPSAEYCLHHGWVASHRPKPRHRTNLTLGAITEETEAEAGPGGHPDFSRLSLNEPRNENENHGSQYSEVSLNSSDLDFFDPRQSKRFRPSDNARGEDQGELIDSSQELFDSIPIMHDNQQQANIGTEDRAKPPKLFGEISHSDFQPPALGQRENAVVGAEGISIESEDQFDLSISQENAQQVPRRRATSASLYGTESILREMNMEPPYAHPNQLSDANGLGSTPAPTPPSFQRPSSQPTQMEDPTPEPVEQTPRPAQPRAFNRQINMPIPPSYFYDPADPSTHNIEYASKVSGHDFAAEPIWHPADKSFPFTTTSNSERTPSGPPLSNIGDQYITASDFQLQSSRAIYGRLISTPDSMTNVVFNLNSRATSFGRDADCSYSWISKNDTRFPRVVFNVFFHGEGIERIPEGQDFSYAPNLYCGLVTYSSHGILINGVTLEKDRPEKHQYGRLHTGDEITVYQGTRGVLKFVVQLYVGEGKIRRSRHGPSSKFRVTFPNGNQGAEWKDEKETVEEETAVGASDELYE